NAYNEHKVQIADLAKGIYFISGSNNQAVTRQKIIVK
ncbi:MAG: T9SS type A sorting domain-containing protein, partial [Bacteroidia bacterium]|nr:T9SS type A sorting domain-containing protein [Bacteroidia bacterium]